MTQRQQAETTLEKTTEPEQGQPKEFVGVLKRDAAVPASKLNTSTLAVAPVRLVELFEEDDGDDLLTSGWRLAIGCLCRFERHHR